MAQLMALGASAIDNFNNYVLYKSVIVIFFPFLFVSPAITGIPTDISRSGRGGGAMPGMPVMVAGGATSGMPQDLRKDTRRDDPRAGMMNFPPPPSASSSRPGDRELMELQDLSRRPADPLDKGGPHGYKGNPRDFDPPRMRLDPYHQRSSTVVGPSRQMIAPPPAHSHHPPTVSGGHPPPPPPPQDLGKSPAHRPDSRNKSPSAYSVINA